MCFALVIKVLETKILILDTASGAGHAALSTGGVVRASKAFSTPRRQAEEIFPAIAALLESQRLRLSDLAAVAVATGPGAFTSLRVGLTAAKSLAEAARLPLIGISNMEAASWLAPGFPAAVFLPASRGEFFYSTVMQPPASPRDGAAAEPVCSPVELIRAEAWLAAPASPPPRYVLSPSADLLDLAAGRLPEGSHCVLISETRLEPLASIAERRFLAGQLDDPLSLDAAYARKHDADHQWSDPRLTGLKAPERSLPAADRAESNP